jgi:hypothetical protein
MCGLPPGVEVKRVDDEGVISAENLARPNRDMYFIIIRKLVSSSQAHLQQDNIASSGTLRHYPRLVVLQSARLFIFAHLSQLSR